MQQEQQTFHLFSEDLGQVVWEQLEWSYKGMFNGMERQKNQNTENKSLLYCHDLRKREPQASNVLKKTEFPKMILKTFQVRKLAFPKKDLIVKKI